MKTVKMSLVDHAGEIVNEWSVPFARRHDALDHAMDRAEQEGHAGVLWAVVDSAGGIRELAFDSHDEEAILRFANSIQPYMTPAGLNVDRLLGFWKPEGVLAGGAYR